MNRDIEDDLMLAVSCFKKENMRSKAQEVICEAFGIDFPYVQMGKIDSLHLFGLDTEMVIFALYKHHRGHWKNVLDIGANLGLHSILLDRYGFKVKAFEPDVVHYAHLMANLRANNCESVEPYMAAVHTSDGLAPFVRVLNNLTGNHLAGFKDSYGPLEETTVQTIDCRSLWSWADFAKIDSEGNEAELCKTMTAEDMKHLSAIVEVRNAENAKAIFEHFFDINVPLWSQKNNWGRVYDLSQMPKVNREGSLYIGHDDPW